MGCKTDAKRRCGSSLGGADSVAVTDFLELAATVLRAEVERPDTLQSRAGG
jgi:hypothetical protein